MTEFEVAKFLFNQSELASWGGTDPKHTNWPVVYTLDNAKRVYVGESIQAAIRLGQHMSRPERREMSTARVIIDSTFNKSACLDLESFLISLFAGDGKYQVDNANAGLTGSNYYKRDHYRERFVGIFEHLRADGMFNGTISEIENSDLFKLSPFKTLNYDQRHAVLTIVEQLLDDLRNKKPSTAVVNGGPGTGKTIIGIYLIKLLSDIKQQKPVDESDSDSLLSGFFTKENAELLGARTMALVVPQQSLRTTIRNVFKRTSGLKASMVLSPSDVGKSVESYDILIVDESHRLQQLSATMPKAITRFRQVNAELFDGDEISGTQLDWIKQKSAHQLFLLDPRQSVRPGSDLPPSVIQRLENEASDNQRRFVLKSQMRVKGGEDYIGYIEAILSNEPPTVRQSFTDYEFRMFDDFVDMRNAVLDRNEKHGLSRLLAGYAWRWVTKGNKPGFDISIDGEELRWNSKDKDWVNSTNSINEVGSIHTIQGYDLNYAGVIIGPDLRFDPKANKLYMVRKSYFDAKGKQNNIILGQIYSDEDLLGYILNIYRVLLSRGMLGTFVYVCDPELRKYLSKFINPAVPMDSRTRLATARGRVDQQTQLVADYEGAFVESSAATHPREQPSHLEHDTTPPAPSTSGLDTVI